MMISWSGKREERDQAQAIEGYSCIYGFKTADKKEFTNHLMLARHNGKGVLKSLGRVNLTTDEAIMSPWTKRSDEQKGESRYVRRKLRSGDSRTPKSGTERRIQTLGATLS